MELSLAVCSYQRRHKLAATLVEILVVIAIIGALAGLLMPALSRVRDVLNATRCTSNMHQIYVFSSSWAAENDGWIPQATWYQTNNSKVNLRNFGLTDSILICRAAKTTNSYGINIRLVSGSSPQWGSGDVWFYTHGRYKLGALSGANTLLFSETISLTSKAAGYYLAHPSYMNYPHRNSANVLYVDGHIETQTAALLSNITTFMKGIPDQDTGL